MSADNAQRGAPSDSGFNTAAYLAANSKLPKEIKMSEPTIEEMRDAVLAVYPECDIFYAGDGTFCILPNRDVSFPDRISGWAESKDVAWRYAYRRLPVKAAPEIDDEAFECVWKERVGSGDGPPYDKDEFRRGWNARARLDAERGK